MARLVTLVGAIVVILVTTADSYDGPRCSTECPLTGNPKFGYEAGYTYVYHQKGKSHVSTQGIQDAITDLRWRSKVELTFLTPCDLAIRVKDYEVEGEDPGSLPEEVGKMSERLLVVALTDGRVQHVCVDPEDDPWSVNTKMSVASYIQNVLPSFSEIHFGHVIMERDIQGRCPTNYTLTTANENEIEVLKEKNNKQCSDRYYTASETMNNIPWLNMPLPLEESNSTCTQRIQNNIYTSIECTDTNVIKPMYGVYKHVKATQKSTLEYETRSVMDSNFAISSPDKLVRKDLKFDFSTPKKTEVVTSKIDELLKETCLQVEGTVEDGAADLVFNLLENLRQAPDSFVQTALDNIRQGKYCDEWNKLESVYLDAVAFLGESGSIPVMVQEIAQERVSGGRTALYAAAFHMIPRPNADAIGSLVQIINMPSPPQSVLLASASMIHTYCRHNEHCYEESQVQQLIKLMVNKITTSRADTVEEQEHVKMYLKALANIGHFDEEDSSAIMSFLENKRLETSVRVAATQTWRIAPCGTWNTSRLMTTLFDRSEKTEVRIASYLSFIRCVTDAEIMEEVVKVANEETNIQVRGFVLSHLHNLQETDTPHKDLLRYLLSNVILKDDYGRDISRFSRNTELSYFLNRLGFGAEIDSNLVYSRESTVPRSVNMNVTTEIFGNMMNLFEIGGRMEGFNPIANEVFGPAGYLLNTPWSRMFSDMKSFGYEKGFEIEQHLKDSLRMKRSIDSYQTKEFIKSNLLDQMSESPIPRGDLYLRLFGQEVSFSSLSSDLKKFTSEEIIEAVFAFVNRTLTGMSRYKTNTTRAMPISLEYSIPTMQGVPLQLELGGAAVLGLDIRSNINIPRLLNKKNSQSSLKISPSLSLELDGFIGFKSVFKHGLKMKNGLHTSQGGNLEIMKREDGNMDFLWNLPDKWDLVNFRSETFMMKKMGRDSETRQPNPSISDVREKSDGCTQVLEQSLGLRFCYKYNVPNLLQSTAMPFGEALEISLSAEKTEKEMEGYRMAVALTNTDTHKIADMRFDTPGSSQPRRSGIRVGYIKDEKSLTTSLSIRTSLVKYIIHASFVNEENFKSVEMFWNFKLGEQEKAIAFKSDLMIKRSDTTTKYDLITYYSPSRRISTESVQIECSLILAKHDDEYNIDFHANTKNDLEALAKIDMNVAVDALRTRVTSVDQLPRLRRWEVHVAAGPWKVDNEIKTTQQSDKEARYSSTVDIVRRRQSILGAKFDVDVRGNVDRNFVFEGTAQVTSGRQQMTSFYSLSLGDRWNKIEGNWDIVKSKSSEKLFFTTFSYEWNEAQEPSVNTKFEIQFPQYTEKLAVDGHVTIRGDSTFSIDGEASYGPQYLLKTQEPMTFQFSQSSWRQNSNVVLNGPPGGPWRFTNKLEFLPGERTVGMALANNYGPFFDLLLEGSSRGDSTSKVNLKVLSWVDVKYSSRDSWQQGYAMDLDAAFFPEERYGKRFKGSFENNWSTRVIRSSVTLDLYNDPSRTIGYDFTYESQDRGPMTARGGLTWKGDVHRYEVEVTLDSPLRRFEGLNKVNLKWTTPWNDELSLEMGLDKKALHPLKPSMNGWVVAKSHSTVVLRWATEVVLEYTGQGVYDVDLKGKTELEFTRAFDFEAHFEARRRATANGRLFSAKFNVVRGLPSFTSEHNLMVNDFDWKYDMETRYRDREMATLNAEGPMLLNRTLSAGDYSVRGKIFPTWFPDEFFLQAQIHEDSSKARIGMGENFVSLEHPSPYAWSLEATVHRYSVEAKTGNSEILFRVSTARDKTDLRFEIGGKVSKTNSRGRENTQVEGHVRSPYLTKDMIISADYVSSSGTFSGAVEVDIFPSYDDKMTLTFTSTRKGDGSYKTEVSIAAKALKFNPSLVIDTAFTNSTKSIDLEFKNDPSEPEKHVSVVYQNIPFGESSLSASLWTPTVSEEVFVLLRQETTSECSGYNFLTNYRSYWGEYQLHGDLCRPAHIELVAHGRDPKSRKYHLNMGLKNPTMAEVKLFVEDPLEELRNRYAEVFGLKADLVTPVLLSLDGSFDIYHFHSIKNEMTGVYIRHFTNWDSTLYEVQREFLVQGTQVPVPELDRLILPLVEEARFVFERPVRDVAQFVQELPEVLLSPFTMRLLLDLYDHYFVVVSQAIGTFRPLITSSLQDILKVLSQLKDLYFSGRLDGLSLTWALQDTQAWRLFEEVLTDIRRDYWEQIEVVSNVWFEVEYELYRWSNEYYNTIQRDYPEAWNAISYVMDRVYEELRRDADDLRRRLRQEPFFGHLEEMVLEKDSFDIPKAEELLDYLYETLEKRLFLNVITRNGHLQLYVPLVKPVYSLSTWPYGIQVPRELGHRFLSILEFLLPYQSRLLDTLSSSMAVYYGDGIFYTWDGSMTRLPVGECSYVLATDGHDHVTAQFFPRNRFEFVLTSKRGSHEVSIDQGYIVYVDGQRIREDEGETVHDDANVVVYQGPEEVSVRKNFLRLVVSKTTPTFRLFAEPEYQGHLQGLMGTMNEFREDDMRMPDGEIAQDPANFAVSWQTDPFCV
ncbi:vitellogenin-like [Oratosquilla oratoria]|uniref:vitellogenin-like n=1 Tax=Oratosquilla oratoria TaxID=337810 RepID=UPI003F76E29B